MHWSHYGDRQRQNEWYEITAANSEPWRIYLLCVFSLLMLTQQSNLIELFSWHILFIARPKTKHLKFISRHSIFTCRKFGSPSHIEWHRVPEKLFPNAWIFEWLTPASILPQVVHIKDALRFHEEKNRKEMRRRQKHIIAKITVLYFWLISAARIAFNVEKRDSFIDSIRYPFFRGEFAQTVFVSSFIAFPHTAIDWMYSHFCLYISMWRMRANAKDTRNCQRHSRKKRETLPCTRNSTNCAGEPNRRISRVIRHLSEIIHPLQIFFSPYFSINKFWTMFVMPNYSFANQKWMPNGKWRVVSLSRRKYNYRVNLCSAAIRLLDWLELKLRQLNNKNEA